jgi:hypothetical protein
MQHVQLGRLVGFYTMVDQASYLCILHRVTGRLTILFKLIS